MCITTYENVSFKYINVLISLIITNLYSGSEFYGIL